MSPEPSERERIRAAMDRILAGTPERSDGALTVVALAIEADVPCDALTQRHTDLKTQFYQRIKEGNPAAPRHGLRHRRQRHPVPRSAAAPPSRLMARQEKPVTTPGSPASGDDTHDLIDDALAELARRRGAWLGDDLTAITLIASLIDQAQRFLPELAASARLNGHSWDEIARAIGTSPKKPTCGSTPALRSPTRDDPTTSNWA